MKYRKKTLVMAVALALSGGAYLACGGTDDPVIEETENQNNDNNDTQNNDSQNNDSQNNNTQNNDSQNNNTENNDNNDDPLQQPEAAGDILLSEFMKSPTAVDIHHGQWIELYNRSEEVGYDLKGCEVWTSEIDGPAEIDDHFEIEAGGFYTIAASENTGFDADFVIDELLLSQGAGFIRLECDGEIIAEINYDDGEYYPSTDGVSIVRDLDFVDHEAMDEPWLWCEGTGAYHGADVGSPGEMAEVCAWINQDSAADILSLRIDADEAEPMTLKNVLVTYVLPQIGGDSGGFFIQASQDGPALFVPIDDAEEIEDFPVRPGHLIDLEVLEIAYDSVSGSGAKVVSDVGAIDVIRLFIPPSLMTADVTAADDLVESIYEYESRLISAELTIESDYGYAGGGFRAFDVSTAGMAAELAETGEDDGIVEFRVPIAIIDRLGLEVGCKILIEDVPMWRYGNNARPSIWAFHELEFIDCPSTAPVSAFSVNETVVEIEFSRPLASIENDGSQFSSPGLDIVEAIRIDNIVLLETSPQQSAMEYTIDVDSSIADIWDHPVQGQVSFIGATGQPTQAMDVVITEFMAQFQSGGNDPGEYIELHNARNEPFNLIGCVLGKSATQNYTIATDILLEPGDNALFTSTAGGAAELAEDDVFAFTRLVNSGDSIFLECGGTTIDELEYPGSAVTLGTSYQKDVDSLMASSTGNGITDHWCLTPSETANLYFEGDDADAGNRKYGTPGGENVSCE